VVYSALEEVPSRMATIEHLYAVDPTNLELSIGLAHSIAILFGCTRYTENPFSYMWREGLRWRTEHKAVICWSPRNVTLIEAVSRDPRVVSGLRHGWREGLKLRMEHRIVNALRTIRIVGMSPDFTVSGHRHGWRKRIEIGNRTQQSLRNHTYRGYVS
jgi:hypothetical protein